MPHCFWEEIKLIDTDVNLEISPRLWGTSFENGGRGLKIKGWVPLDFSAKRTFCPDGQPFQARTLFLKTFSL